MKKVISKKSEPAKAEKPEKAKKVKPKQTGRRKGMLIVLWSLFALAFAWSIYKNFTAVDTHTVHEVEVVETEVVDTSGMESFVKNFAKTFHTYNQKTQADREKVLGRFMTEDLARLNNTPIAGEENSIDLSVADFAIWQIEDIGEDNFRVTYEVTQKVKRIKTEIVIEYVDEAVVHEVKDEETGDISYDETIEQVPVENKVKKEVEDKTSAAYHVIVHADEKGDYIVIQNPTITGVPGKSEYTYSVPESDNTVDSEQVEEIKEFLGKFFALYPQADETQLAYYVKEEALTPIFCDFEFVEIQDIVCKADDGKVTTYVTVSYKDKHTGVTQLSQYALVLEKDENWFITSNNML